MSETKPWSFKLKNAGNGFMIREEIDGEPTGIADVFMTNLRSVAEDRARLMSASPELLEALTAVKDACAHVEEWDGDDGGCIVEIGLSRRTIHAIRLAVKKAGGL